MKAIILAAGFGTRLKPITDILPKPLVPVAGTANIVHIINHLKQNSYTDIYINTHYLADKLALFLNNEKNPGVNLHLCFEPNILGTGGGIKKMLKMMKAEDPVVIMNGDILFAPDIKGALNFHTKTDALATMVVKSSKNAQKLGAVGILQNGKVDRLVYAGNKDNPNCYMFTGVHIISPDIEPYLPDSGCIVQHTYIPMVKKGAPLFATVEKSYFCDIGTPESYLNANIDLVTGQKQLPGFCPPEDHFFKGKNVREGKNCKIKQGSVICDDVTIEDNVIIEKSIVLNGATVKNSVKNAIVLSDDRLVLT
jgi:NDP-sugar pyrophosphorylase family protein